MSQKEIYQLTRDNCIIAIRFSAKEKGKFYLFKDLDV